MSAGNGSLGTVLRTAVTVAGLLGVGAGVGSAFVARGDMGAKLARVEERAHAHETVHAAELRAIHSSLAAGEKRDERMEGKLDGLLERLTEAVPVVREPRRRAVRGTP